MEQVRALGLGDYFLYPQINWNAKSSSLKRIAERLNIGMDTIAFIDDDPVEREEVKFTCPEVLCLDAADLSLVPTLPEMIPRFITEESRKRRFLYLQEQERNRAEEEFAGAREEFLSTLGMVMTIEEASEEDLKRAEELTVRTHQLNTTGTAYSYDELDRFRYSDRHRLLLAGLEDRFGSYGKIGLALVATEPDVWTIKLLLMSCRVMSRGVGTILINHIRNEARKSNVRLQAEMIPNEHNRMMYMTLKFTHFREMEKKEGRILLENDLEKGQEFPHCVQVKIAEPRRGVHVQT
jgi:FkbH-like protein